MPISTYSTGTVAIAANATSVVGAGSNWTGQNAMSGDLLVVGGQTVIIQDVTDATHLAIDAWPFSAVSAGSSYKIYKVSPLRFVGALSAQAVDDMVTALNTNGFYVFVGPNDTVPDPSLGQSGQYAFQATTGKQWQKVGGVWDFIGTFKGFGAAAPWDASTAYLPQDVVSLDGTSYVCILANTNETPSFGDSPPNPYWTVLAEKGDAATISVGTVTTGAPGSDAEVTNSGTSGDAVLDFTIPAGEGYGGTSTTSIAIGTGSKAFTTQSGLAYTNGARVRASSAADTTNWMEGLATYSGTTLTVTVTKTNGSGTHADWNFNVVGEPGAGDLSSSNNLSDVADAATALGNLGGLAKSANLSDVADAAASRTNLGLTSIATAAVGQIPGTTGTTQPAAGFVGEEITASLSSSDSGSGVVHNTGSLTLTPGIWDLEAFYVTSGPGATTTSDVAFGINTSISSLISGIGVNAHFRLSNAPSDLSLTITLPRRRVVVSSDTTYYFNFQATFSGGSYGGNGEARATRVS